MREIARQVGSTSVVLIESRQGAESLVFRSLHLEGRQLQYMRLSTASQKQRKFGTDDVIAT
jgi:hypothetical protein